MSTELRTQIILDLDAFRDGLQKAKAEGEKEGKRAGAGWGDKVRAERVRLAADAGKAALRGLVDATRSSIDRLADQGAPAVRALSDLSGATSRTFDTLLESVLGSSTAQTILKSLTDTVLGLADEARDAGKAIDGFVKRNLGDIVSAAGYVTPVLGAISQAGSLIGATWDLVVGSVTLAAGVVAQALAGVIGAASALAEALGADGLAKSMEEAAQALGEWGEHAQDAGKWRLDEGINDFVAAALKADEVAKDLLARFTDIAESAASGEAAVRTGGVVLDDSRVEDTITAAWGDLADRVTGIFEGATQRIAAFFRQLADDSKNSFGAGARELLRDAGGVFDGISALGIQSERAFGKSAAAAKIFARVQMGLQAVQAGAKALFEAGEAKSAFGKGNFGQGALHAAAATAFAGAAAIAGGQVFGAFGAGPGPGREFEALGDVRAEDQVVQRTTNITIVVNGNLIDNRDYVRNELIPALRQVVEEGDVVLNATHARTASSVGGP